MGSDEVLHLLRTSESRRIVMELTEQVKVDDYPRLSSALTELRLMGVRLAIDDTGAGFASLAHILKLGPDIIKLDRELTCGIDHDPVRRALAAALVTFAAHTGADIIAEGIETAAELEVLQGLGIRYGQGYFLGRPTSVDSIPGQLSREVLLAPTRRAS
jgi:EAL domain-containing protein (putative c-di-GMP-specific phosphodiesterase class I)